MRQRDFSLFTIHYSLFTKRRKLTRLWLVRHFQNLSRITLMRRICSFTDFYCVVGFLCACGALGLSRITSCRRNPAPYRRKYNPKEIREKIKSVASVLFVNSLSACGLSRRRRSTTMGYCLPDSLSLLVYNPETSSRVTLALLGTGFQTALTVLARHVQNQSRITRCDGSVLH